MAVTPPPHDFDELDNPVPPERRQRAGDDTHAGIAAVQERVEAVLASRDKEHAAGRWKLFGAVVACAAGLLSAGAVFEQSRQTRDDVARVLVVVEQLGRDGASVNARLNATERELRELDKRVYDARQRRDRNDDNAAALRAP